MAGYYKRGKFLNKKKLKYAWVNINDRPFTGKFVKTLIIRGIGYRAFTLKNDFLQKNVIGLNFVESFRPWYSSDRILEDYPEMTYVANFEFNQKRYLTVRAGHTKDLTLPLHPLLNCIAKKKNRKLAVHSQNKTLSSNLAKFIYKYRKPSVYTGRGVRVKHIKPPRKAGKKDKQRGRAF